MLHAHRKGVILSQAKDLLLPRRAGFQRLTRALLSAFFALGIVLGTTAAGNTAARTEALSHQMMCTCGCNELLGECNHVGCPNSGPMLIALRKDVAGGMSNQAVLAAFQQEYGPTVLASPLFTRFNHLAWVMPPAVLILGILLALVLLRRWKQNGLAAAELRHEHQPTPHENATLNRIRRETEQL